LENFYSVVPIPIVHSPTEKSDYRPISILPVLAKAFENVMYKQMVNYVDRNDLILSFQSGFRPGHSTAIVIARVSNDIRLNMESNQPTILVCAIECSFLSCSCLFFFLGIKNLHVGTMFLLKPH
jgi:hypothetical protein